MDTGKISFGIINPPLSLAIPAYADFLIAVDEDESLRAEVSALFTEFEDKVPSFWFSGLGTNIDSRSAVPVVYAHDRPGKNLFGNYPPTMVTEQVFGVGAGDEEWFSTDDTHEEFSWRMLEIVKRFDV